MIKKKKRAGDDAQKKGIEAKAQKAHAGKHAKHPDDMWSDDEKAVAAKQAHGMKKHVAGKGTKKAGNAKKTMEHGKRRSMKATLEQTPGASLMTKKKKRARDVEKASKKVAKKYLKKRAMKK